MLHKVDKPTELEIKVINMNEDSLQIWVVLARSRLMQATVDASIQFDQIETSHWTAKRIALKRYPTTQVIQQKEEKTHSNDMDE